MDQVSITSAYMLAAVVMAVFFALAVIISNLILFKPNNPGTTKRKIWFWALCVATGVVGFVVNYIIAEGIDVPNIKSGYLMHSTVAAVVCVIVYFISGLLISKCFFPNSKVGTWF